MFDLSESDSVHDEVETWYHFLWDDAVDQTVDGSTDVLHGINGCVHDGVDVQFTWSFGDGGNEPIEVDPEQIPDHGINGIRQKLPRR